MKKLSVLFASLMMLTITSFAGVKTEKLKVYGKCGMCESRIETAVKAVDGVSTADWDKDTKMLEVTFDESKTDIHKINKAVNAVGHDTEMMRAEDKAYENLPGCCKYDRAPMKGMKMNHDQSDAGSSCKSKGMEMGTKSCCNGKTDAKH
ncbi:MAG: ATPase [Chlorobi bacterium]|nr:ATPase [Chlorobiota bacterium]